MIDSSRVRREIEHIRRSASDHEREALQSDNMINWLRNTYYRGDRSESQLEMFIAKYPSNANAIKSYVLKDSNKLRLTTKQQ